jgi:hypothetical protein
LQKKSDVVRDKLAQVKAAAPGAWDDLKTGVNNALDDLQRAWDKARSRIK